MIRAIIFDLDGTLLDTLPDLHDSVNKVLRLFNYPEITLQQTRAYIGNGARELIRRALPALGREEECFEAFAKIYAENEGGKTAPYEGAAECLRRLKAAGYRLAIVTNKPHFATVKLVEKFFPDTFDFYAGDDGSFPRKPDPTLARYCALSMRVACGECLFVGDGEPDCLTAANAHMRHVGVLWGYRTREELSSAGAADFVSDFKELENFVKNS